MGRTAAFLAIIILAGPVPARADEAARLALSRQVVETAHVGEHMRAIMPTFLGQMRQTLQAQGADDKQFEVFLQRFQKRFEDGLPSFTDLVSEVYAREFSEEDLSNLLAFYRSPTGQHLLDKQVTIAQGMAKVGGEWGRSIAGEIIAEFEKEKAAKTERKL